MAHSRRDFLGASSLLALTRALSASAEDGGRSPAPWRLTLRPTKVFKTKDRSHEDTESWIVSLIVESDAPLTASPFSLNVELFRGQERVRSTTIPAAGLKALTYVPRAPPRLPDGRVSPTPLFWPYAIRLRHTEPAALQVDAMRMELQMQGVLPNGLGERRTSALRVQVEQYRQKTELVFPFRGKGIILQAGATNGGHRNRSGQFAIDAFGLDEAWSIIASGEGKENRDYRGWGRELLAPADGVVVRARADRPDQPGAESNESKYYAPEFKDGGDPGNHLVIDHDNDEFSMLAHFQAGSMKVKEGDMVRRGQVLGKLGHSGDSTGPHCHYQLQAGPDWENADGLPCVFRNVKEPFLDRGTYFEAT